MADESEENKKTEPRTGMRWDRYDTLVAVAVAVATFFVHPIHLVLTHPFWFDEAWVAVLTRVPWKSMPSLSSSTPVGFVALLRLVPGAGLQRGRIVVLLFSIGTVVMAYVLARSLQWTSTMRARFAGIVAAIVVMLAPISLGRNDLKQYTCDAFCALVVLTVAGAIDRARGRFPVWWLAVASLVVLPFSSVSAFVTVAAYTGLFGSAVLARSRRRILTVLAYGTGTALGLGAYFLTVVVPNTNDRLRDYWNDYYVRGSLWNILTDLWDRLADIRVWLGVPVAALIALFFVGVVALARLRAPALAIAAPVLWIEMAQVGRMRRYPFLDLRTSQFLFIASFVVAAIGAAWVVQALFRMHFVLGGLAGLGVAAVVFVGGRAHVNELNIKSEYARAQTLYVAEHRAPHDVILVNDAGSFGFAYYWPGGKISTITDSSGQGYRARVRDLGALYAHGRDDADILDAMSAAVKRWHAAGPGSRLFIVRSHVEPEEAAAWERTFAKLDLHPVLLIKDREPLLVLGPETG